MRGARALLCQRIESVFGHPQKLLFVYLQVMCVHHGLVDRLGEHLAADVLPEGRAGMSSAGPEKDARSLGLPQGWDPARDVLVLCGRGAREALAGLPDASRAIAFSYTGVSVIVSRT